MQCEVRLPRNMIITKQFDDTIPSIEEIKDAVELLKMGKMKGPSGISEEHLARWRNMVDKLEIKLDKLDKEADKIGREEERNVRWNKIVTEKRKIKNSVLKSEWNRFIILIQMVFRDAEVPHEMANTFLLMIPKRIQRS